MLSVCGLKYLRWAGFDHSFLSYFAILGLLERLVQVISQSLPYGIGHWSFLDQYSAQSCAMGVYGIDTDEVMTMS